MQRILALVVGGLAVARILLDVLSPFGTILSGRKRVTEPGSRGVPFPLAQRPVSLLEEVAADRYSI